MNQPSLLALLEDAAVCVHHRHERVLAEHHLHGGCCNHDVVCDDCGATVGTESWRLDIGGKEHDRTYGVAA